MQEQSLISVVIPVYNGELYLAEAIESVLAQENQHLEIIVVDDGSTDNSAQVVAQFGTAVRYHYQPKTGQTSAQNRGIQLAQGSFLAFLDADDLWVQGKLTRQLAAFAEDPDLDISFGHVKQFHSPELDEATKRRIHLSDAPLPGFHTGCMLLRLSTFLKVGLFSSEIETGPFIEWYARAIDLKMKMKMKVIPEVLMLRRLHSANFGITESDKRVGYARVLGEIIRRRRQLQNTS